MEMVKALSADKIAATLRGGVKVQQPKNHLKLTRRERAAQTFYLVQL